MQNHSLLYFAQTVIFLGYILTGYRNRHVFIYYDMDLSVFAIGGYVAYKANLLTIITYI